MKPSIRLWACLGILLAYCSTDQAQAAAEKPVKVYILAGQSNMVGIGQVNPAGMTRYNTYVSKEDGAENGCVVSIYAGAYDPAVDYDAKEPVETHIIRVGYWPHQSFPTIEGEQTQIARGYIKIDRPGRYTFRSGSGSICEVAGQVVHSSMPGHEVETKVVDYEPGIYPITITFNGKGKTNLTYSFFDLPGSLYTVVKERGKYPELLNDEGEWASRDDVWYKGVVTATANKWLSVGCGASNHKVGPELGFGWVMGEYHKEPVLIIKASQGNRSLAWDFLPPGSERYTVGDTVYAGYKDRNSSWPKGTTPEEPSHSWYAGKQYDDCFNAAKDVLANFDQNFPMWEGRDYEIAGFVWWQGHKDSGSEVYQQRYEQNLVRLIKALRKDFDAPETPFVVATIGFHGWDMPEKYLPIAEAQLAVDGDTGNYPRFKGNVNSVETRDFWKSADASPKNQDYHYNQNGETYLQVGHAMGKGMIELLKQKE